jgi:hypothetical protein
MGGGDEGMNLRFLVEQWNIFSHVDPLFFSGIKTWGAYVYLWRAQEPQSKPYTFLSFQAVPTAEQEHCLNPYSCLLKYWKSTSHHHVVIAGYSKTVP